MPDIGKHILDIKPYSPGKPIEEVKREYGLSEAIKLASNENPLGPSPKAKAAIEEALSNLHLYPDGSGYYLKRALSERLSVPHEGIILGNGSNELIELITRTFMSLPGLNAVTSECTFVVYRIIMQACDVELRETPMTADMRYDLSAMANAVDANTRLIFIANPNNPTGTYVTQQELDAFIDDVDGRCAGDPPIIVLDEAYTEYITEDDYPDGLALMRRRPRTMLLRTFSKAYGLAGIRLGYGVAEPRLWDRVNRIRQPFNVNSLALVGGLAALDDHDFLRRARGINEEGKAFLSTELKARGFNVVPSQTNFILVDFQRDAAEVFEALLREGTIVRPMKGYGLPTSARISIGLPEENRRLIEALDRVFPA
jgi:histidinol-phosphate aminotransferase